MSKLQLIEASKLLSIIAHLPNPIICGTGNFTVGLADLDGTRSIEFHSIDGKWMLYADIEVTPTKHRGVYYNVVIVDDLI